VSQIEVGLSPVVGDVDLTVLVGTHRPRIDVDVGVKLLQRDSISMSLEQRPDRRCREALSQRGYDSARDENVFDRPFWIAAGSFRRIRVLLHRFLSLQL
jgi:hypothetical protein